MDRVQADIAIRAIVTHIRRIQPHVIVTFGPEGGYGHPDHIAVSQFTTAAAICAADIGFGMDDRDRHVRVLADRVESCLLSSDTDVHL